MSHALFSSKPVLPRMEMAAYESLWLQPKAGFSSLAKLFADHPGALPSELVTAPDLASAESTLRKELGSCLSTVGIRVHQTLDYPSQLRDAEAPPELIYFRGDWELISTPSVAVVGTRTPTDEGVRNADRIARALARNDFTVVSGLARGIDAVAHRAALDANGRTIAVIGTPLSMAYPRENKELQDIIAARNLLISQVPFLRYARQNPKSNRYFFPARNVTMSAITRATIIVEAGDTSGTLVQARAALKQKRRLFILDSCFRNPALTWPAEFAARGAVRVETVNQLMKELMAINETKSY